MKWTLITGGAKRLGAQLCLSLADQGNPILIHYNKSQEEAEQIAERCRQKGAEAQTIQGNFSSFLSLQTFAEKCKKQFPEIKTLINNVGNYLVKSAEETSPEEWAALFQTNLHAPFALTSHFLPALKACKGHIINIGVSGVNSLHGDTQRTAYMATKMALLMLTKSLARELAPTGVRVNMVSPGYLENAIDLAKAHLPMKRAASLDEIANVILFLLDKNNSYITGQNIEVAGGIGLLK